MDAETRVVWKTLQPSDSERAFTQYVEQLSKCFWDTAGAMGLPAELLGNCSAAEQESVSRDPRYGRLQVSRLLPVILAQQRIEKGTR